VSLFGIAMKTVAPGRWGPRKEERTKHAEQEIFQAIGWLIYHFVVSFPADMSNIGPTKPLKIDYIGGDNVVRGRYVLPDRHSSLTCLTKTRRIDVGA
jgi:hypothetical protein